MKFASPRFQPLTACWLWLVCVILLDVPLGADEWPTHLHDARRTGVSSETLRFPLTPSWSYRAPHPPRPAWPEPARQDYWNEKTNLRPRITHDRANAIVVANGKVVFGSSADDQVRALDATSGALDWTYFTEGPVRLAPTIWKDLVVFGSDDGYVHGLDISSGKARWKTRSPLVGPRRIPGNGRIISERPLRSGVLIDSRGTGLFTAGIFPRQRAYYFSIDVRNGSLLDHAVLEKSVQGYLQQRDGHIFAPTGRDPAGMVLTGKSPEDGPEPIDFDKQAYSRIADSKHLFWGGDGEVFATTVEGNRVWHATVRGRVYSLAIAHGQLFASTDQGWIHAFGGEAKRTAPRREEPIAEQLVRSDADAGEHRSGYALFIDPSLTQLEDWVARTPMQTVVAISDEESASRFRTRLAALGVYGRVVVHHHANPDDLPYADHIFNFIAGGKKEQVRRLLCPRQGVAQCQDGKLESSETEALDGEWTHTYGNPGNTAASDARIGNSLQLQWFGGPGPRKMVDRHMRTMPPLVSDGMLYVPGLDRITAVDAFNGSVAWELEIPGSTRIAILKDCGWMAAWKDQIFVASQNRCVGYKTADRGAAREAHSLEVPIAAREWGYLSVANRHVIGSATYPQASRRTINREAILEGGYSDNRPIVCSDQLFAFELPSQDLAWTYQSRGSILHPSISVNGDAIFFLASRLDLNEHQGRIVLNEFLKAEPRLVAVDLRSGRELWSVQVEGFDQAQNAYVISDQEHVYLVNSRNEDTVHYDARCFRAASGEQQWAVSQDNELEVGGDHGEQDKHPVLVGHRLIVEPFAYDSETGRRLEGINLSERGYGCGTLSASAEALFFRSGNPASYSFASRQVEHVTTVSRPGCWINMIPAAGMLFVPEGSSGCTCDFPVQTSMAFTTK